MSGVKLTEGCMTTYQVIFRWNGSCIVEHLCKIIHGGWFERKASGVSPMRESRLMRGWVVSWMWTCTRSTVAGCWISDVFKIPHQEIQKSKKHRYATFVIQGGMIEVETVSLWCNSYLWKGLLSLLPLQVGDRNNSYQDFLNDLHQKDGDADDCRYGVYDYDYQFNPDGAEATFKSKIFLMSWCPDSSKIKKKMLYSSSFDTLKRGE